MPIFPSVRPRDYWFNLSVANDPSPERGTFKDAVERGSFISALLLSYLLRYPFTPLVVLHILLPWLTVAMVAAFPDDFTLALPKKNAYRKCLSLGWVFLAFCSLAVYDTAQLVNWRRAVSLACLPALAFFAVPILVHTRRGAKPCFTPAGLVALGLFSALYGYGVVRELNVLLDDSPAKVTPAAVLTKFHIRGSYGLSYAPWNSGDQRQSIWVTRSLYRSVQPRERVCMVTKEGGLGMPWYSAQACPWNGKIEFPSLPFLE
jgi:hypothetical protein